MDKLLKHLEAAIKAANQLAQTLPTQQGNIIRAKAMAWDKDRALLQKAQLKPKQETNNDNHTDYQ